MNIYLIVMMGLMVSLGLNFGGKGGAPRFSWSARARAEGMYTAVYFGAATSGARRASRVISKYQPISLNLSKYHQILMKTGEDAPICHEAVEPLFEPQMNAYGTLYAVAVNNFVSNFSIDSHQDYSDTPARCTTLHGSCEDLVLRSDF